MWVRGGLLLGVEARVPGGVCYREGMVWALRDVGEGDTRHRTKGVFDTQ